MIDILRYALGGLSEALVGLYGARLSRSLSDKGTLSTVFAGLIFAVALYMLWKSWPT